MLEKLLSIISILIWCFFGYSFVNLFVDHTIDLYCRIAIGIPIGMILFTWVIFILNLWYKFSPLLGWSVTLIFAVLGMLLYIIKPKTKKAVLPSRTLRFFSIGLPTLIIVFFMKITFLYKGSITRGAVYGDLPFHMNIISSFVYGCNSQREYLFDIVSPFYANVKLAYPVLVNFLSAILIGCFHLEMPEAGLYPSIPMVFAVFVLLNKIVRDFSSDKIASFLAPWIFLFLGGRGFLNLFNKKVREEYGVDFVHNWGNNMYRYWLQTVMHVLLPQRLSLFGLPFSYGFLVLMDSKHPFKSIRPYLLCGILVGLMPQVQAHACIAAFEWTLAYAIIHFPWKNTKKWWHQLRCYFALSIPAFALALPQLLPYLSRAESKGFFSFVPIWDDDQTNFFSLWWDGLFMFWLISIFVGPFILYKNQLNKYIPALFVFICSNLMHYQPWNIDNSKVFYAGWIPYAVAVVANYFAFLYSKGNNWLDKITTALLITTICSGLLAIASCMSYGASQWNPFEDVHGFAKLVIEKTEPKSVWATDSFHDHPVPTLAGRQVLVGYRGWLMSHLLDETERIQQMTALCVEPDNTGWMDKNNVTYVCYHKSSQQEIFNDINKSKKWDLWIDYDQYKVYKRNNIK